jgi:glycosyltransferase involved in cell wall biosynthesis
MGAGPAIRDESLDSHQDSKGLSDYKILSIVIPALNEELAIGQVIDSIPVKVLEKLGYSVETLVVDNGSEDRTSEIARSHGARVVRELRRGYGRAYKTGITAATGEIITTLDADLTYPAEIIPELVLLLQNEKLDFITTNRLANIKEGALSKLHQIGNRILSLTMRVLFRIGIEDSQSGMWIFRKSILQDAFLRSDGMSFSAEIKIECCCFLKGRWKEVPIEYRPRIGQSKVNSWSDGWRCLSSLIAKRLKRGDVALSVEEYPTLADNGVASSGST